MKCIIFFIICVVAGVQGQSCWWSGCQPKTWAERGCYPRADWYQTESQSCDNGDMYHCCARGSSGSSNGIMIGAGISNRVQGQSCWWSGCQPKTWTERGCYPSADWYQTESQPCDNGDKYHCCARGSSSGPSSGSSSSASSGSSNGVTISVDISKAPHLANFAYTVQQTLMQWYPLVSNELSSPNYNPPKNIPITFDPNYNGVAYASGGQIVGSVQYYTNHQNDVGSMVHELIHVIQQYENCPGWLTEGIADWIRYYKYEPGKKPGKPKSSDYFTMGYGTTAYFLEFIINNSLQWSSPYHMVYWANKDCREGSYSDSMWPRMTRKTLDQHWQDMMNRG